MLLDQNSYASPETNEVISDVDIAILEMNWSAPKGPEFGVEDLLLLEQAMIELAGRPYYLSVNSSVFHSFGAEIVDVTCPLDDGTTRMFYTVEEVFKPTDVNTRHWGNEPIIYGKHYEAYDEALDEFSLLEFKTFLTTKDSNDYSFYLISCADNPHLPNFNLDDFDLHDGETTPAGTGVYNVKHDAFMIRQADENRVYNSTTVRVSDQIAEKSEKRLLEYKRIISKYHFYMPVTLIANASSKRSNILGLNDQFSVDYQNECIASTTSGSCLSHNQFLSLVPDKIVGDIADAHFYDIDVNSNQEVFAYIETYKSYSDIPIIKRQISYAEGYITGD